jgi:uncharacterized Ntn-hydrolase superfamily protein
MLKVVFGGLLFTVVLAVGFIPTDGADSESHSLIPASTYSIVAFDPETGQLGAAVQSHYFRVADVIWVEPNVGAVATQSFVDFAYGPLGIEMLWMGKTPQEALDALTSVDPQADVRQVAMIDDEGNVAAHTGERCITYAGHQIGPNYSVQANLMRDSTVPAAMAEAFETTEGTLAERLMAALEAAEAEGGDIRGKQSAAIRVVTGEPTGRIWEDRIVDLRVDDHAEPIKELRRLLTMQIAYDWVDVGDELFAEGDIEGAALAYGRAMELAPDNIEIKFWYAVTLVSVERIDEALPVFRECFEAEPIWRELVPRMPHSGLLPDDEALLARILEQ